MLGILLSSQDDITQLFSLSKFLPFLDLFQKESVKVEACKAVLAAFQRYSSLEMLCAAGG